MPLSYGGKQAGEQWKRRFWSCTASVLYMWLPTPPGVLGFFAHDLTFLGRCSGAFIVVLDTLSLLLLICNVRRKLPLVFSHQCMVREYFLCFA